RLCAHDGAREVALRRGASRRRPDRGPGDVSDSIQPLLNNSCGFSLTLGCTPAYQSPRGGPSMTRRLGIGTLMLVALCAPAWATVDLNGSFVGATGQVLGFGPFPCAPISVTQTGTALSFSATCDVLGSPATFTGSGTIDTGTGAFSVTGQGS